MEVYLNMEAKMTTTALPIRSWVTALVAVCLVILLGLGLQCRDPHDWQPGDPQTPPPDPPVLYLPAEDTIFFGVVGYSVVFDWEEIPGYQVQYEIQTDTAADFSTAVSHSTSSSPMSLFLKRYSVKTNYYGRVRAGSPAWTWYTDWSPTHHFYLMPDALR